MEMKKKEFEERYIKDDRTEDEKMMDAIHHQARMRRMNDNMDRQTKEMDQKKKEKKNERIAIALLIAAIVILVLFNYVYSLNGVKQCVAAGHSENWCVYHG